MGWLISKSKKIKSGLLWLGAAARVAVAAPRIAMTFDRAKPACF